MPMVPRYSDPSEPPRSLSPEVEAQLVEAIRVLAAPGGEQTSEVVTQALQAAGREARERKFRSEELLLLFKRLEHRIGVTVPDQGPKKDTPLRSRVVRALLQAYYAG
jgi:hypothetical protein